MKQTEIQSNMRRLFMLNVVMNNPLDKLNENYLERKKKQQQQQSIICSMISLAGRQRTLYLDQSRMHVHTTYLCPHNYVCTRKSNEKAIQFLFSSLVIKINDYFLFHLSFRFVSFHYFFFVHFFLAYKNLIPNFNNIFFLNFIFAHLPCCFD